MASAKKLFDPVLSGYIPALNPYAPKIDRLMVGFAGNALPEDALPNLGVGNLRNSEAPGMATGNIAASGAAPTGILTDFADPAHNPYAALDLAYYNLFTSPVAPGSYFEHKAGTILFAGFNSSGTAQRIIVTNGTSATSAGGMRLGRTAVDNIVFGITDPAVTQNSWTKTGVDWATANWVAARYGPKGAQLFHNDPATPVAGSTYTGPMYFPGGSVTRFNSLPAGSGQNYNLFMFYWFDAYLSDNDLIEYFNDWYLGFRPRRTIIAKDVIPQFACPQQDGGILRITTGASVPEGIALRVEYGPDPDNLTNTATSAEVGTDYTEIDLEITGLPTGATWYYRASVSSTLSEHGDDTEFVPLRGGLGTMVTQPPTPAQESSSSAVPDEFTFVLVADDHNQNIGSFSSADPENGFGAAIVHGSEQSRRDLAIDNAMRDIADNVRPSFAIHLGDWVMMDSFRGNATDDYGADQMGAAEASCNMFFRLFKTCPFFWSLGNHDGESGYYQNSVSTVNCAMQKQSASVRKRFIRMPRNDTYRFGGENEGAPSTSSRAVSWQPPMTAPWTTFSGGYANYINTYVIDADGYNASPLENYYAFEWGDALIIVLDVYRYTDPGGRADETIGAGGAVLRSGPVWTLGQNQKDWLANLLRTEPHKWKVVCIHNLTGGESIGQTSGTGYYGRGSAAALSTEEELELHELFKETGVVAVFKGHDHTFAHVLNDTVNYVTVPSLGAPNMTTASEDTRGWPHQAVSYGTAETGPLGYPNIVNASGEPMPDSLRVRYNVLGYLVVTVSSDRFVVKLRRTDVTRESMDSEYVCASSSFPGCATYGMMIASQVERYVGPQYEVSGSSVTLSETPYDVVFAAKQTDLDALDDALWTSNPADVHATYDVRGPEDGYEAYFFDEGATSASRTLSGVSNGQIVRVAHYPGYLQLPDGGSEELVLEPAYITTGESSSSIGDEDGVPSTIDGYGIARPADDILGIPHVRDNWVYGNPEYIVHASIEDPASRILQYKINNPAGAPITYWWNP